MKKTITLTLIIVIGLLAQTGEEARKVLEETNNVLEKARIVVVESGNPEAKEVLQIAVDMQAKAWGLFKDERFKEAIAVSLEARENGYRAIKIASEPQINEEFVRKELERTSELMGDAGPVIKESGNKKAAEIFGLAVNEQEKAKEAFKNRDLKLALKLTYSAREHTKEALKLVKGDISEEDVKKELERTDQLIEKAGPIIKESGNKEAMVIFEKGVAIQQKAKAAYKEGNLKLALKLTLEARELVFKALKMVEGQITPEEVAKAIKETDDLIQKWSPQIKESGNKEAIKLLENAISHQDKAKSLFKEKKFKAALAQTDVARKLLKKAIELIGPVDEEKD